jgi:septal ring factor EnvC (AmiA/AmiB activator)
MRLVVRVARRRYGLAIAIALGILLVLPAPSFGDPAKASESDNLSSVTVEAWVDRIEVAAAHLEKTRAQLRANEESLARARHRRYPRGDTLEELETSVESGRAALEAAEAELPELIEQARRAGVPPGELRRFEPEA